MKPGVNVYVNFGPEMSALEMMGMAIGIRNCVEGVSLAAGESIEQRFKS
jgi:hypothetical protein